MNREAVCFDEKERDGSVTIISVYYNREKSVDESVNSLINQKYNNYKIILVDDGSTDNTFNELKKFESENCIVYTKENTGFVDSITRAIDSTNSEFIAIHGSGDISYDERIEKQVEVFRKYSQVGVVGAHCEVYNEITKQVSLFNIKSGLIPDCETELIKNNFLTQGEVMFRRSVYDDVGGYSSLYTFAQDYDLWLRMSKVTEFYVIPNVIYRRISKPDGVSGNISKLVMQQYLASFARRNRSKDIYNQEHLQLAIHKVDHKFRKFMLRQIAKSHTRKVSKSDMDVLERFLSSEFGKLFSKLSLLSIKITQKLRFKHGAI
ncbi:glycosyltransferase [Vibrio alginolyticus]|uniref:glycosyltransferase n=1 Tax=Vibrio sp. Vb1729 TaxID=3074644 RepID=UPI0029648F68|nr:glycosyltransferase [Vibrio sp. Vb1729]EGQ9111195.1 glycosyltransferase [Vibrio alginolyticus]EJL6749808.1 glycosyltransferase [Vibrio alginolyticus]EMA9138558.1 glycosyltransferase [Vibrio alginolyticus]MDW1896657.1 glycosyltransferase [Vibrio sp. Vb1729]